MPNLGEKDAILLADGKFQTKNGTIHQAGDFANDGTSRELSFKEPQISQDDYGQTNIDAEFSSNKAVEYAPMEVALHGQISDQVESNLRDIKFEEHLKNFNNQMDNLVVGIGVVYGTVLTGGLLIESAPVWAPYAATEGSYIIGGIRTYHTTIGLTGGYVSMGMEFINQTSTQCFQGEFSFGNYDIIGLGTSSLLGGKYNGFGYQIIQGTSSTMVGYSVNKGKEGLVFKQKSARWVIGNTLNGMLTPLMGKTPILHDVDAEILSGTLQGAIEQTDDSNR